MAYHFLDTSAILDGALQSYPIGYISPVTLTELEDIKKLSYKEEHIKQKARQAINQLLDIPIHYTLFPQHKVNKLLKKYNFLTDINDHKILCEAELLGMKVHDNVEFITCDHALYLFAQQMPHLWPILYSEKNTEVDYNGWISCYPNEKQYESIYSNPTKNIFDAKTNEFIKVYEKDKLKDILFWNGEEYRALKYKDFISPTGEHISPHNIEQKMYLDLLQNDNIPIKLCIGRFGTGKSMFAENWAIHQVMMGKYDKIVFVKNNLDVKGAGKLGILPGNEIDKQYPWLRQIEDHLGPQLFEQYLDEGRIEPAHLSTLRGRDLKNCIILVDEAENLLTTNIQLLLGRVAANSQIIFCADVKQCDYRDAKMSGIPVLINRLVGNKLFGMIQLVKSERSQIAATADLLD